MDTLTPEQLQEILNTIKSSSAQRSDSSALILAELADLGDAILGTRDQTQRAALIEQFKERLEVLAQKSRDTETALGAFIQLTNGDTS